MSELKLVEYWKTNVATNYKKISAILGSMLITILSLILYGFRTGLDLFTILMTVVTALNPFLIILISIVFRGESELKDKEIIQLKQNAIHDRQIAEYKIQLIGLQANADWVKYNNLIADIEALEKTDSVIDVDVTL